MQDCPALRHPRASLWDDQTTSAFWGGSFSGCVHYTTFLFWFGDMLRVWYAVGFYQSCGSGFFESGSGYGYGSGSIISSEIFLNLFDQNCNLLMSKLQEKPSALKKEHLALREIKYINFFLCLWVIFCPPGSGYRSRDPHWIRIRIHSTVFYYMRKRQIIYQIL